MEPKITYSSPDNKKLAAKVGTTKARVLISSGVVRIVATVTYNVNEFDVIDYYQTVGEVHESDEQLMEYLKDLKESGETLLFLAPGTYKVAPVGAKRLK